jgi:hypothetical protein
MGQMTTPKPLNIIIWECQEMMAWMSMDMVGSMDVIWLDFGPEVGKNHSCYLSSTDHKSDPAQPI